MLSFRRRSRPGPTRRQSVSVSDRIRARECLRRRHKQIVLFTVIDLRQSIKRQQPMVTLIKAISLKQIRAGGDRYHYRQSILDRKGGRRRAAGWPVRLSAVYRDRRGRHVAGVRQHPPVLKRLAAIPGGLAFAGTNGLQGALAKPASEQVACLNLGYQGTSVLARFHH